MLQGFTQNCADDLHGFASLLYFRLYEDDATFAPEICNFGKMPLICKQQKGLTGNSQT
jgi:hypothetical protein